MKKNKSILKLVYAAICLALALVLPFLTGQIQQIGAMLCPMHLPVLLCGFLCGWPWGLAVGFCAPFLRFILFGMPPLFPTGVGMAFELAAYGFLSGLLYRRLPKKPVYLVVTLLTAMIGGRVVWGAVRFAIAGFTNGSFPFSAFLAGAVTNAVPGIIAQLILVPVIVLALRKARLIPDDNK